MSIVTITIKSSFWTHRIMGGLPDTTQLLALALLSMADKEGYFNADPRLVKAQCMPYKEIPAAEVKAMLDMLASPDVGWIELKTCNGEQFGRVVKFNQHQALNEFPTELKRKWFGVDWDEAKGLAEIQKRNEHLREIRGITAKGRRRRGMRPQRGERKGRPTMAAPAAQATGWQLGDPIVGDEPRIIGDKVYFVNPREKGLDVSLAEYQARYPKVEV